MVGKATTQLFSQAVIQRPKNPSISPVVLNTETPETTHDMNIDRKKLKISWVYNETPATATWEPPLDDNFPDIVLRGAARLNPKLRDYYGQLPRTMHHYGGWYSMTDVNWPLIGPMGPEGAFQVLI